MLAFLKSIIDTFGSAIIVPFIIFVIAKVFRISTKKSFLSAIYAGVALQGFSLILNSFTPIVTPVINRMVESTGVNRPVFDVGWQATSLVAFSSSAGMIYLGLGILLQTVLFLIKWTDVFQPSDLWNNYSYMVWGAMVIRGNRKLSFRNSMYGFIESIQLTNIRISSKKMVKLLQISELYNNSYA